MRVGHVASITIVALLAAACSVSGDSGVTAGTAGAAGVVSATPDSAPTPSNVPEPTPPDTSGNGGAEPDTAPSDTFVAAPADWGRCADVTELLGADPVECATVEVPLDYADPGGTTIPIALIRQRATSPDDRVGSVVFNPGGPGGSGIEYLSVARFVIPADVAARFDLVSFDPRGVGASASVNCDLTRDDGVVLIADDDRAAWDDLLAISLDEIATCSETVDGLAPLVGTNHAARDLDEIREAIGDDLLTYVGFSYGTRLGATYAELFPERIRALVLDGAVVPSDDFAAIGATQSAGFDAALETFAAACDADADCLLREIGPTLDVIEDLRAEIAETGSFETDDGDRVLTPGELDLAIVSALYSQDAWNFLTHGLYLAEIRADGSVLQALADLYLGRQYDGSYTNQIEAGGFINCADDPSRPSDDEVWDEANALGDASEYFGAARRASTGCLGLPDPVDPILIGPADGAPPILVIGTTGDPATPYEWSVQLAEFLASGVLYTVEGEGHTAYTRIDCVTGVVNDFLIDLVVPAEGGSCTDTDDTDVFPPVGESDLERVVAFVDCLADEGAAVEPITLAEALADPSGIELFADLLDADGTLGAIIACESLLPG